MSDLITPKKAAEILGVLPNTIRNWERDNKISAIKTLGGHRRYHLDEIKKLLENNNKKD
jgi:excisionase family DNA binding protein